MVSCMLSMCHATMGPCRSNAAAWEKRSISWPEVSLSASMGLA